MLAEVVALSPKISLNVYDLDKDAALANKYRVDKAPAIVLAADQDGEIVDYGVRIAGIPAGHEFSVLIHDVVLVSKRDSGLKPATRDFLKTLTRPVNLQVFTTPT
jgi:alkyl hydroperoxide reductase subunit AhpF